MANPILTKNYDAGAAIAAHRIVKWGSADKEVVQASAATDFLCGVADYGADAQGDRVDVHHVGTCNVEYGGNVTRGHPLTSDADGKAIQAAPGTGANMRIVGYANVSGADGDIGEATLAPGEFQGA